MQFNDYIFKIFSHVNFISNSSNFLLQPTLYLNIKHEVKLKEKGKKKNSKGGQKKKEAKLSKLHS